MAIFPLRTKSLAAVSMLAIASTVAGQGHSPLVGSPSAAAVSMARPLTASPVPPAAAPGQFTQTSLAAAPVRSLPPVKPFQTAIERPTISPYLQLHRDDFDDSLPNYFAFVLPQIHQQELLQKQQAELQNIQKRLQQTASQASQAAPGGASAGAGGQPTTFHARFLNTGGYFSGVPLPQQQTGANR